MKQNWFNTLNEALLSEDLLETWEHFWSPIKYGETRSYVSNDVFISIYRDENGKYERPIHYKTLIKQ